MDTLRTKRKNSPKLLRFNVPSTGSGSNKATGERGDTVSEDTRDNRAFSGAFMLMGFLTMAISGSIFAFQMWNAAAGVTVVGFWLFLLGVVLSLSNS